MKYRVWVKLEMEYDDIEADSPEEAFEIASDWDISSGCWDYSVKKNEKVVLSQEC